ncbi:MAG: hypothetical protein ACJ70Y_06250, partial [Nitrososphaera sp.]
HIHSYCPFQGPSRPILHNHVRSPVVSTSMIDQRSLTACPRRCKALHHFQRLLQSGAQSDLRCLPLITCIRDILAPRPDVRLAQSRLLPVPLQFVRLLQNDTFALTLIKLLVSFATLIDPFICDVPSSDPLISIILW